MSEALGDGDDGDAVAEHLGGHEVPQVVQPEAADAGTSEVTDERLVTRFGGHGAEPSHSAENTKRCRRARRRSLGREPRPGAGVRPGVRWWPRRSPPDTCDGSWWPAAPVRSVLPRRRGRSRWRRGGDRSRPSATRAAGYAGLPSTRPTKGRWRSPDHIPRRGQAAAEPDPVPVAAPPQAAPEAATPRLAGLSHTHSQRTAWVNARCNTTCTRCTVPARQRPTRAPGAQQMPVDIVNVHRRQLVHRQMTQQRLEVTLDDAAGLAQRRSRPGRRRMRQPAFEEIGDRTGSKPGITGLLNELAQLSGVMTTSAHLGKVVVLALVVGSPRLSRLVAAGSSAQSVESAPRRPT